MRVVLDTGALLAVERGDRRMWTYLAGMRRLGVPVMTHGGVVGQAWRGGSGQQVPLARVLATVEVLPLDDELGRRSGVLLGRSGTADVIDAAVMAIARDGDDIVTSDPRDLGLLADAAGAHVELIRV